MSTSSSASVLDIPSPLELHPERVRMLTLRRRFRQDPDGGFDEQRRAVLVTATPGLYLTFELSPCECPDAEEHFVCWHRPTVDWHVIAECGMAVCLNLSKGRALGLAAGLADVSVDWTAGLAQMLALRSGKGDAWMAAAAIVSAARFETAVSALGWEAS